METHLKLVVAYDGTHYLGWQKTPLGPTIEESLQQVLEQILQEQITLQATSRTDAGVHASGQVVSFVIPKRKINLRQFYLSVNRLLPKDITVLNILEASSSFHPTTDCTGKEYHYFVCYDAVQLPQNRLYSWHYPHKYNAKKVRSAAQHLIHTHDFSAFCNFSENPHTDHVRTIKSLDIEELPEKRLRIKISGDAFLYKMVRNIVGTLMYVSNGKIAPEAIPHILSAQDRKQAGMTAPAHGLVLHKVHYP